MTNPNHEIVPSYPIAIFDLDGTLTDSARGILNSLHHAFAVMGVPPIDPGTERDFLGPPLHQNLRRFLPPERVDAAVAAYREYFVPTGMFENDVYAGVVDTLELLVAAGVTLAVATSKAEVYAERILDHFDLSKYFAVVGGATLDGVRSRKADVLASVLDRLGRPASETAVMFGDREHDVLGATTHNIACYGVLWGYGSAAELEGAGAAGLLHETRQMGDVVLGSVVANNDVLDPH